MTAEGLAQMLADMCRLQLTATVTTPMPGSFRHKRGVTPVDVGRVTSDKLALGRSQLRVSAGHAEAQGGTQSRSRDPLAMPSPPHPVPSRPALVWQGGAVFLLGGFETQHK